MYKRAFLFTLILVFGLLVAACAPAAAPAPEAAEADTAAEETAAEENAAEEAAPAEAEEGEMAAAVVVAPGETIRIGGSFALTGPIPDPGLDIQNAAEVSVADVNAAGGIEGFELELVAEDGACDGTQGTAVANKFAADDSIVAVSGGTCSGETFGLIPVLQKARIPFVSPSATNPDVTSEDCDVCNRVALSDAAQGATDANYAFNDLGIATAAVMHDNSDYGKGLAELFMASFEELGGVSTDFEGVQVGDTDFRAALAKLAANSPEMIFFGGYGTEAALIVQQMLETPGLENTVFMSDDGSYTQQYLETAGEAAEGSYASFIAGDDVEDLNAEFDAKYLEAYGVLPDDLGPFHAQSYDSVQVIADAISRVATVDDSGNLVIEREALVSAIRDTDGLQGLSGMLSCDGIGECGAGGIQIFQVQDGEFVQVSGFGLE